MLFGVLGALMLTFNATPAFAESPGASASATAHALDELKNAIAQGKITITPTPTLTATAVPATATRTPAPRATDTPEPAPADPPLPVLDPGQAVAAYVRPSPRDPSGTWLELALPQGRWAVLYDGSLCTAPTPWTNVWLALDDQSDRPMTADRDDGAMCAIAHWSSTSDVPCAEDDQGVCDLNLDSAYWDAIAKAESTTTDTPVPPARSEEPTPSPSTPRPVAPSAASVQVQRVVQTVVVLVTAVPSATPLPTAAAAATSTPRPTLTSTRTATTTPTGTPTVVTAAYRQTPVAVEPATSTPRPPSVNWSLLGALLGSAVVLLAAAGIGVAIRRRTVVRRPRPPRGETYA